MTPANATPQQSDLLDKVTHGSTQDGGTQDGNTQDGGTQGGTIHDARIAAIQSQLATLQQVEQVRIQHIEKYGRFGNH